MAPFDPAQLLKALDSFLSPSGGIKSLEDASKLVNLMKKFSKKLVSRCIYCNVLQATETEILSEYLDKGGWETIYTWLQDAKSSDSNCFLIEMLKLCKLLPMTVDRLKENNTAKLIKSLTKVESSEVKQLSHDVVTNWMAIIKVKKPIEVAKIPKEEKKKKKEKSGKTVKSEKVEKPEKSEKTKTKDQPKKSTEKSSEAEKKDIKLKPLKRGASGRVMNKEDYEDVKLEPEFLAPVSKKPKQDRPKTAKIFQKKFRATGLLEETPLPKNASKKSSPVDKTAAVAAAKNVLKLNTSSTERIVEKKIKPETFMVLNETTTNKGVKLIPAKPKPTHVLHESPSFMDALTSQPVAPVKRKKKTSPRTPNSPTSPVLTAPKLQFYKETLETNEDKVKKEDTDSENKSPENEDEPKEKEGSLIEKPEPMDIAADEGGSTPPIDELRKESSEPEAMQVDDAVYEPSENIDENGLRSILSHGKRRGKKKSIHWAEEENIKEIFYFEMDETERINVLKLQNLGDIKLIDSKRERETYEQAKRQAGDKMEEMTRFWTVPILIDIPLPSIEHGCHSTEKELESLRQQSTLQEIYFTREMIPDTPHEPDFEIVPSLEPKIINLDEDNTMGSVMDYSNYEMPKPVLPDVLSNVLMKLNNERPISQPLLSTPPDKIPFSNGMMNHNMPHHNLNEQSVSMSSAPYDPGEPLQTMPPNAMVPPSQMQHMFNNSSPPRDAFPPPNDWRGMDNHMPPQDQQQHPQQQQYFGGRYPPPMNEPSYNHNMMPEQNMNMRPRMMNDMYHLNSFKGPRNQGPRPRLFPKKPCRHFKAGNCRFGISCSFLHPGVNGPAR